MKTFKQFQEDYTRVINPVKPVTDLIGAGLGAYELGKKAISGLSNIFQSKGKFGKDAPQTRKGLKNIAKNVDKNKLEPDTASEREELVAKSDPNLKKLDKIDKAQDNLLDKINSAQITKPKKGEKQKAKKVVDTFKKVRKKEGETMMKIKQDNEIATKGLGDQVPKARRDYLKNLLKNLHKEEVAIANSMSGGGIAGSVEAGDEPPVNKRKKKGEPTIIARGCMPGARGRFKGGVELLANLKKNKYT